MMNESINEIPFKTISIQIAFYFSKNYIASIV